MPISKNIHTQLGVHFEEVVEMIQEIEGLNPEADTLLSTAQNALHDLANFLKQRDGVIVVRETNRLNFLDAIVDQLVTATGVAHMLHMDPVGGLDEVNRSNWSKFDENGEPYFDQNQKVAKGPNYRKANLAPFV